MKKSHTKACLFALTILLTACAAKEQSVDISSSIEHSGNIEPQKGKLTVEMSLARGTSYNINAVKQKISPKILGNEAKNEALKNLEKFRSQQTLSLAVSLKELDFAIFYTAANTINKEEKVDTLLNQMTAQNLVLGTLKAHKSTLFGQKKLFETKRLIRQYQMQLATLLKRSPGDSSEYRQALENNIDKLKAFEQTMEDNIADFRQLVKVDAHKLELDGRRFFDTIALQPQTSPSDYQTAAFENRLELQGLPNLSLEDISQKVGELYSDSLSVEGVFVQDTAYQEALITKGDQQANALLRTALDYQKASSNKKNEIFPHLTEELYKAVYLQVETAYELARKTTADYELQKTNIQQIKEDIRKLEKTSRPSEEQKIDLLNARFDLLENETLADQILAEKALAITGLRFYSGQINIPSDWLKQNLDSQASFFKRELQKNLSLDTNNSDSTMYSDKTSFLSSKPDWAHKDNWLENLINENPQPAKPLLMSKPLSSQKDYDRSTIMQLGSFLEQETAQKEWKKLTSEIYELKNYEPHYEQASIAGIPLFRLFVKSPKGGLKNICAKLRQKGHECLLYD